MKVDFEEVFMDIFEIVCDYVPESDHVEMYTEILKNFLDSGLNINVLYGHDDEIDEALDELIKEEDDFYEDDF